MLVVVLKKKRKKETVSYWTYNYCEMKVIKLFIIYVFFFYFCL